MTRVALLWHMHQPFYQDLVTGEHILPWVRLHVLKDYFGMGALLREFPSVQHSCNRALPRGTKPAAELTYGEVKFMRANFFHAQRQRMLDVYPRYAELLAK